MLPRNDNSARTVKSWNGNCDANIVDFVFVENPWRIIRSFIAARMIKRRHRNPVDLSLHGLRFRR